MSAPFFARLVLLLLLLPSAGVSASPDLQLAQRYFKQRIDRGLIEREASGGLIMRAASGGDFFDPFELLPPPGAVWTAEVSLSRAPRVRSVPGRADLVLLYRVLERVRGPVPYWRVRAESDAWGRGVAWEQEIFGDDFRGRIRICQLLQCSPWRDFDADAAVPTGGIEAGGAATDRGLQVPIFLPSRSLGQATRDGRGALRWEGEDFFGRTLGWEWPEGKPWPGRLWSAQGEVRP